MLCPGAFVIPPGSGDHGVMAAIAEQAGAPSLRVRAGWAVIDTLIITRRNLLVWMRVPACLVFTVVQPVIFVLLFRDVFGGAIPVHTVGGYVNYLIPGIIAQTAAFATFGTAIALAQELKKGVIDRCARCRWRGRTQQRRSAAAPAAPPADSRCNGRSRTTTRACCTPSKPGFGPVMRPRPQRIDS